MKDWLSAPGAALLDVAVNRFELVMPAKVELDQVFGMALYSVKGVLAGRGDDVFELVKGAVKDL